MHVYIPGGVFDFFFQDQKDFLVVYHFGSLQFCICLILLSSSAFLLVSNVDRPNDLFLSLPLSEPTANFLCKYIWFFYPEF